jgi:hypothetical protein
MGIHLITFAGEFEPKKYMYAAYNLQKYAQKFNLFEKIKVFTYENLFEYPKFYSSHIDFIKKNPRGFGYWIWKPFLIYKYLESLKEGDILFYVDTCTYLNVDAKEKFLEYIEIVKKNKDGNLFFEYDNIISHWCKMDTLVALGGEELLNSKEVVPGVLFITANEKNIKFFQFLYHTMCNYHLIDDSPSELPNVADFHEHRHDQSVFSILTRLYMPDSISSNPNSTDINFNKREELREKYPIWIQSNLH